MSAKSVIPGFNPVHLYTAVTLGAVLTYTVDLILGETIFDLF